VISKASTTSVNKENAGLLHDDLAHLQNVINEASVVIYVKDKEGRFLMVNRYFEALFNTSGAEIAGKTDFDIFPEKYAQKFRRNDLKVIKECTPIEFDEVAPHEDSLHHYISIKFPLSNSRGDIYGVCGISTDITERKKAKEQLSMMEEKWRHLWNNVPDAILEIDTNGVIQIASQAPPYGPSIDQVIGTSVFDYIPKYQHNTFRQAMEKAYQSKKVERYEIPGIFSGKTTWWHYRIVPLEKDSKVSGFLVIATDITNMKLSEQELAKKNYKLERLAEAMAVRGSMIENMQNEIAWLKKRLRQKEKV